MGILPDFYGQGGSGGLFGDMWAPVLEALKNGQFDPQGMNNMPPPMTGNVPMPQPRPDMAPQMPPQTMPVGLPMGEPPQPPQQPPIQPPWMPQQSGPPGMGDRLMAAGTGFFNAESPMQAIGNVIGGAMTGQRQDQFGIKQEQQNRSQHATYQALRHAGLSEGEAMAAALNPEVLKTVAPQIYTKPTWGVIGEDPITQAKQYGWIDPRTKTTSAGNNQGGSPTDTSGGYLARGVTKYDPALPADEYMAQFNPDLQAAMKSWLNGDTMPTGNPRAKQIWSTAKQFAQTYADKAGIPASDSLYTQKREMKVQLARGTPGSLGGQIIFAGTSLGHLADVAEKTVKLDNVAPVPGMLPGSENVNNALNQMGNSKTNNSGKRNEVTGATLHYGQEITKFYTGSPGGEAERMRFLKAMDVNATPQAQAGAIRTERDLIPDRVHQIERSIAERLGPEQAAKEIARADIPGQVARINKALAKLDPTGPEAQALELENKTSQPGVPQDAIKKEMIRRGLIQQ